MENINNKDHRCVACFAGTVINIATFVIVVTAWFLLLHYGGVL